MGHMKKSKAHAKYFLCVIAITAASTITSFLIYRFGIDKENVLMVFLVGVLATTVLTSGYWYSILAALFSVLLFNFFFTYPTNTFRMENTSDVILLFFFLGVSLITSTLTSKFRKQADIARLNERMTKLLYEVTGSFLNIAGEKSAISLALTHIYRHTGCHSSVSIRGGETTYDSEEYGLSEKNGERALREFPIKSAGRDLGSVRVYSDKAELSEDEELIIRTVTSQLALVLDREFVGREQEKIRIAMEREHVKSNLLRAISHDLRTPLTGIVGASSLLNESGASLDQESVRKLVRDINEEALWLTRLVENILNMTRIGEGKLEIHKSVEVVDDIVNEAVSHVPGLLSCGRLKTVLPRSLVSLPMDGILIVQVLTNLLDNALKHTNEQDEIILRIYTKGENAVFEVQDSGPGIDESIRDTLFESFVTAAPASAADAKRGVGLGLSVCKAIINAHGGTITAQSLPGHGALFRFTLPLKGGDEKFGK